jgi:hypothetical protein
LVPRRLGRWPAQREVHEEAEVRALVVALSLLVATPALADGPRVFFLVKGQHASNAFKRPPEPTFDRLSIGARLEIGNFEVDVTHGYAARDCANIRECSWKPSTEIEGNWTPGKGRELR